jgi:hypothetical protein
VGCRLRARLVGPAVRVVPGAAEFQGSWWFATTDGHVGFESWVERDAVMLLDFDPDVVAVSSHLQERDRLCSRKTRLPS